MCKLRCLFRREVYSKLLLNRPQPTRQAKPEPKSSQRSTWVRMSRTAFAAFCAQVAAASTWSSPQIYTKFTYDLTELRLLGTSSFAARFSCKSRSSSSASVSLRTCPGSTPARQALVWCASVLPDEASKCHLQACVQSETMLRQCIRLIS